MKHGKNPFTTYYYIWNKSSAVFYSSNLTPFHSHNTIQVVLDMQNSFRFRLKNGQWNTYQSLIIKDNIVHQLDTNKSVQLIIYLDTESPVAKAITSTFLAEKDIYVPDLNIFHMANSNELEKAMVHPEPGIMKSLIENVLGKLSRDTGISFPDKRILLIEQTISNLDPKEISLKMLAGKVYLSESRLRSLFKKVTGTPIHRYILWNKIRFATNQIMAGNSVYDAAIESGFTDSSHLHKMMVQQFGITPSDFIKNNKLKKFIHCDKDRLFFKTTLSEYS
jgi:AraC-like DNA-binding protein